MAIIDNNQNNQTTQSAQQAAPQAQQPQQGQQAMRQPWSFHQQGLIASPVAAGVGGEYFTKFRASLTEIYKDIVEGVEVRIISLNRQNMPSLRFSSLVVACRMNTVNSNAVAFHTLILEATGEKLQPVFRNIDNQQVKINRTTGDAYDEVLYKTAYDAVTAEFPNATVYPADAMVVPSSIAIDMKDAIENIARNAALACVSVINAVTDNYGELNLAYMDRDCRFVFDVTFGNHQVYDVVGNPQRSSVLISYSSQKKTAQSVAGLDTVNVAEAVARICEMSGFIQPIWAPTEPVNSYGFQGYMNPNVPQPTQKFAAEFVITSVRTDYATSPAAVLLAVSSFLTLVENDNWIQAFLPKGNSYAPQGGKSKIDITDIGALNITANLARETDKMGFGTPMDIASLKGDIAEINKYLVSIFRPGVVISMDCPEAGAQSWYLSVFAAAASGDQAAYNQIYAAANELTNNGFQRYFKQGDQMFTNVIRVPLGHYRDTEGRICDIRNVDYTAIANMYQNQPERIHEYSNTFVERPGVSAARNLAIREGMIMDVLNHQAEITGYAARVSFSDSFVLALSNAIADCNLPVQVNTPINADMLRTGVAAPSFIQNSLAHGTRSFGSGYGTARVQQPYRYGAQRFGVR